MKALIIPADITKSVELREIDFSKLEEVKTCLDGGWLELLKIRNDTCAYIDEEGKLKGLQFNLRATSLILYVAPNWNDIIVGPMIVFSPINEDGLPDGNEHNCPDWVLDYFNIKA